MAILTTTVPVYPPNWPDTPFHSGELELQERFGVREHVHSYAPRVVRPFLPEQHQDFYQSLPFLVVAARDKQGSMWASLLMNTQGQAGFVTSPTSSTSLSIHAQPVPGDALEKYLTAGTDLGILGIEFATKRRNRVNGHIKHSTSDQIEFQVDQSFGNCPQYIRPRTWWTARLQDNTRVSTGAIKTDHLTREQIDTIQKSDTLFVATGYRGDGDDVRFGNDASHRGGTPGWIHVKNATTIFLPDFAGNNHYNTLGNIYMDNRMGMTIPQLDTGGMIQLSGRATLHLNPDEAAKMYPGALHVIEFHVEKVVELPEGSLPVRWTLPNTAQRERTLQVICKIKESNDVTSFHLAPLVVGDKLWPFKPGQHLPIVLPMDDGDKTLMRTYSLSSGTDWGEYRISVKREPFGQASRFLHDTIQVGDTIQASEPAGDFVWNQDSDKTLVLISAGIGVTPVLSMLHSFVVLQSEKKSNRKAIWVHGARNGKHHAFQHEVLELTRRIPGESLKTHVVYSQPRVKDNGYDSMGRMDANLLRELVPDLQDADYYMCGTAAFLADMQDGLEKLGVPSKQIQYETF